jgi:hypothetical protein
MPKSSRRFWIFGLVAGVLALCATRATSRYEGDTTGEPGRSIVLCDAKRAYEAAAALAEFADARYKQLAEPQWDTLYFKSANDPRRNPAQYLRDLKSEITKARQKVAKNGDGNPQQAEKNYQAARQQFDDVEVKYIAKLVQTSRLQREIQALMQEIQSLNAKLASTRKAVSLPDQKERTAKIKACETTISTAQTKLQSLLFSEKESSTPARRVSALPTRTSRSFPTLTSEISSGSGMRRPRPPPNFRRWTGESKKPSKKRDRTPKKRSPSTPPPAER